MFDWDTGNLDHIAMHGIHAEEVEEALLDLRRLLAPVYQVANERRRGALGATMEGRLLFVIFTRRGNLIRAITARDATERERRRYRDGGK